MQSFLLSIDEDAIYVLNPGTEEEMLIRFERITWASASLGHTIEWPEIKFKVLTRKINPLGLPDHVLLTSDDAGNMQKLNRKHLSLYVDAFWKNPEFEALFKE